MVRQLEKLLIVLVLAGQFLAQGLYFPGIGTPIYLLLLVGLGLLTLFDVLVLNPNKFKFKWTGWSSIFILLLVSIIVAMFTSGNFRPARLTLIIFSVLFCLGCAINIKKEQDVKLFFNAYTFLLLISSIVTILQSLGNDACISLWRFLHVGNNRIDRALNSGRYFGLSTNELSFAYEVTVAFIITLFTKYKKYNIPLKLLFLGIFIAALIINATRSAWIATVLALIIYAWKKTEGEVKFIRVLWMIAGGLIISAIIAFVGFDIIEDTRFGDQNAGTTARISMFLTAFNHAFHYPLGLGVYSVQPGLIVGASAKEYNIVLINTPHNLLANCVGFYGLFALLFMLLLYLKAYQSYKKARRIGNGEIALTAIVCLISLALNSFFHNLYILNGELSSFLFFGILASISMSKLEQPKLKN